MVGGDYSSTGVVSSYYDSQVSGLSDTGKGEPRTTAEMKTQSTFENWDFGGIWILLNDYPVFMKYPYFNFREPLPIKIPMSFNCKSVVPSFIQLSRGSVSSS